MQETSLHITGGDLTGQLLLPVNIWLVSLLHAGNLPAYSMKQEYSSLRENHQCFKHY